MIWKKQPVGSKLADLQNNKASKDTATQSAAGLMSALDKTKLDGIATGATAVSVVNNLNSDSTTSALSAAQGKALNSKIVNTDGAVNLSSYTAKTLIDMVVTNGYKIYYCSASGGNKLSDLPITQAGVYIVRADTYYKSLDFMGTNGHDYHYDYTSNSWTSLNSKLIPLTNHTGVITLSSSKPAVLDIPSGGYGGYCFFGMWQGLGYYPIAAIVNNNVLTVKYVLTGTDYTGTAVTFSYNSSTHKLTISQTSSGTSNIYYIS